MSPSAQDEGSTTRLPTRSKRLSYPSSSVPTTPWQHAHSSTFRSRTPSPGRRPGNQSPRSVISDSRSPLPSLRQPTKCRFMSTQTSRRRIPYTIGSDMLEDPSDAPKAALEPEDEKKLTDDMKKLYESLIPSSNSRSRRHRVVEKLKVILEESFPGKEIQVFMFGSSGNLLCTSKSDVDICITMKELESTCVLAEALSKRGMEKVTCVHAKAVPIVKIWDPELLLACDLNVNNHVAVKNTQLIKTYIELDDRVRPLAMIIKHWAKQRILNEASGGALSSYTWTLLIINFLQTRSPPVLPVIDLVDSVGHQKGDFSDNLRVFRNFGQGNAETIGELFFYFFRRYGYEVDYQTAVVSVRRGKLITKTEKNWQVANNNRLCVEEPFNTDRNLGNTADDTAFRGIHIELRQAFERIVSGKDILSSVCEKYEFPPEEPKTIFERPQPNPRPVIARSASQSGRGGRGRGNKHQNNYRNGQSNRRASSGAVFGPNSSGFSHNPIFPGMMPDFVPHMSQQQQSLHNQLAQMHQDLQLQEYKLKAVQMMHVQAAQAQALAQSANRGSSTPTQGRVPAEFLSPRFGGFDSPTSAGPSQQGSYPYPFPFPSPIPMSQSSSQPGTDTNQSSPSMAPATLRRGLQRASTSNGTSAPAARSHSQPARPMNGPLNPALYPRPNNVVTPNGHMQGRFENAYPPSSYRPGFYPPALGFYAPFGYLDPSNMTPTPREYLGYGIGESPQLHPQYIDPRFPIIPPYEDLMRSRGRSTSEYRHGTSSMDSPFQASSHSPSPRISAEDFISTMSPTLMPAPMMDSSRSADYNSPPIDHMGPFVVNGSHSAPIPAQNGQANDFNLRHTSQPSQMDYRAETNNHHIGVSTSTSDPNGKAPDWSNQETPEKGRRNGRRKDFSSAGLGIQTAGSPPETINVPLMGPPPPPRSREPSTPPPSSSEFPALEEKSRANRMSPELRQRVNRRVSSAAKSNIAPLDLSKMAPLDLHTEEPPQSAPLLSPVLETRTPSPTTARKPDPKRDSYLNGSKINDVAAASLPVPPTPLEPGAKENMNGSIRQSPVAASQPPATAQLSSGGNANNNPWQQAGGKKSGKRNKSVNLSSAETAEYRWRAEPLPSNEAERKGG